jgi:uncharacterized protein (DUF1697 family)
MGAAPAGIGTGSLPGVKRYAAFLRGVSPMNLKMPALARSLESAGFAEVKTLLSSGNALFSTRAMSEATLERRIEQALDNTLGRTFLTIVRSVDSLRALIEADPFAKFRLKAGSKRIVTFLRSPPRAKLALPIEIHGARILAIKGKEVFTAYVPSPRGAVFMTLIEKTFGTEVTTRTWDTVAKAAR